MKTLKELEGWIYARDGKTEPDVLWFVCPVCPSGHGIAVSWEAPSLYRGGAVWKKSGSTLDDITIEPSINCDVPHQGHDEDGKPKVYPSLCKFHGWVKNGQVTW